MEKGLKVGLGTDIAGGPSASMYDVVRMAVVSSRVLEDGVDPDLASQVRGRRGARQDWRVSFHLATAGGAAALGLPTGSFARGQAFDAQLIDVEARAGTVRVLDDAPSPEILLEKILFTASRANIAHVWVAGRRVSGAAKGEDTSFSEEKEAKRL